MDKSVQIIMHIQNRKNGITYWELGQTEKRETDPFSDQIRLPI